MKFTSFRALLLVILLAMAAFGLTTPGRQAVAQVTAQITGASIADGTIANADISTTAAIAFSKFAALTSGQILVGNGSNVPAAVAVSGDITISNAGVTAIGNDKVLSTMMSPLVARYVKVAITSQNILDMNGAPVTVIASPGAGKSILVHDLVFTMTRTGTAYANGGAISFEYATGQDVVATIAATVVTGAAGTTVSRRIPVDYSDVAAADTQDDVLRITNATAPFITGTGTAVVEILFSVLEHT